VYQLNAQLPVSPPGPSEQVIRINNLGIAEMEQFHFTQAAGYFQKARELDPKFPAATVNLGIALFYDRRNEEAEKLLTEVIAADPKQREARYVLGLLLRSTGRNEEALAQMRAVLEMDPLDVSTLYFSGTLQSAQHNWDEAIAFLRKALERDPVNVSIYYTLATALVQKGDVPQAEKVMAQFQELKSRGTGTSYGNQYMEQGHYAQAIRVSMPGGTPAGPGMSPRPRFVDAAAASGIDFVHAGPAKSSLFDAQGRPQSGEASGLAAAYGSGFAFLDYDGDGLTDLFFANSSAAGAKPAGVLYRNAGKGVFRRASGSGAEFKGAAMGVAAGDYDNDGRPDLFVAGHRGSALYHNEGNGRFADRTSLLPNALQQAWAMSPAFADVDHDGDLDLFVSCAGEGARNFLYRNNGDGKFTEIASGAGVAGSAFTSSVAFLDYNASRDIDVLLVNSSGWQLLSNRRDGSFGSAPGAPLNAAEGALGVATGDFNGDGRIDFCGVSPGRPGNLRVLWNREGRYTSEDLPIGTKARLWNVLALDYDNDADLDILAVGDELRILENSGRSSFEDVTADAGLAKVSSTGARAAAAADYDQDGDFDIVVTRCGASPLLLRNDGGSRNRVFRLALRGKSDNQLGIGSKVEWAAGGLWQHREIDAARGFLTQSSVDVLLGLGKYEGPDYVRILWPTGVLQTEIPRKGSDRLVLNELDRKGTSCPILYAWDGSGYRFITDFLGGSAMGYLEEPGRYAVPDSDEYVKIGAGQLRPRNGRLSLKMANQLEEIILFDRVRLLAVDHPRETEIYPNERLKALPPFPEHRIYTAASIRPVAAACDGNGRYWTDSLASVDRDYVRGFRLLPYKGYAEEHSLILDLGDLRDASRTVLLMDGWIDYATSTSNFAAAQAGLKPVPPMLQVWESGKWKTVLEDMGFPAGLPKTMLVDLSGAIERSEQTRIRIVTNMRIYWDRIRIEAGSQDSRLRVTEIDAAEAGTSWIGYPRQWSQDGKPPFGYDFDRRDAVAPWKTHSGGYTRLGDVRELLARVDDRYVTLSHGEVITAEFEEEGLPPLPQGWVRDWLLFVDGFGKDMDLYTQHPDGVDPLPRHRDLPYRVPGWELPSDAAWQAFREGFLTRDLP
jgi:Flp pilus assembly protein TadD